MKQQIKIEQFFNNNGKITQLPQKQRTRIAVLECLSQKFQLNHNYTEKQVNAVCEQWHTFGDYFLLRRELVDNNLLTREKDGSRYWRTPKG